MASRAPLGPSAPWYEEEIEYVRDDVLFAQTVEAVVDQLCAVLEKRVEDLRSEDAGVSTLMTEIRRQMTVASSESAFGEVRALHDLALELLMAADNQKRAV